MTPQAQRTLTTTASNLGAAALGGTVAVLSGPPLAARIPLSAVAGTIGFLLGGWVAGSLVGALRRARVAAPGGLVYDLRRLPASEETAGGKAANLARLAQAGFRVPAGFVALPRAFAGNELTPAGRTQLQAALTRLGRDATFAVRSSAKAEDSATASFAGSFETVLDVPASGVEDAVRRVRGSGQADRVLSYSAARGVGATHGLAVVVQRMLTPDLAGVLFTVDPVTADLSTMVGNVVAGQGEGVVSGEQNAAEFTCERPGGAYSGPPELAAAASQLHTCAHDVETLFGGMPQDIEWAVAAGRVWILQARPVTTLNGWNPVTAERNDSLTGRCLWSATNLTEANPEPQTPLTISMVQYQQDHGGPSMKLRGREMAGSIGGRAYANLTVQVSARGPKAIADPRAAYRQIAGMWGELPAGVPIPVLPLTKADWQGEGIRLLAALARLQRARYGLASFLDASPDACRALGARVDAAASPAELLALWHDEVLPASLRAFWAVIAATDDRADPLETELVELVGPADAADLLGNLAGLAGGLASLGPAAGLQDVLAGRLTRQEYLDRFGHRGHNETELAWPRPAEDPGWLDRALSEASQGPDVAARQAAASARFDAALARLRSRHPGRARVVERRLRSRARRAARREAVRSEAVRWTGLGRRFALRCASLLGIGEDVFLLTLPELLQALGGDTSAYARFDERRAVHARYRALPPLPAFILGAFDPFAWAADPDRPADIAVAGVADPPAGALPAEGLVRGAAGSPGVAEGRVRRLDSVADSAGLLAGEVLVTHLTNIGWTPAFPRAAALVTDLGAPLSHATIVAREFGLPAVVGCRDATARLATGDLVRVDGARGLVEVIERAHARDTLEHVFDSAPAQR